VPTLSPDSDAPASLRGKTLGIINGGAWITLWSYFFARRQLPGVRLVNVGNEAVQLNFMRAHHEGRPCPPQENIDAFGRYARDLVDLCGVDAILISCSTMNRAWPAVRDAVADSGAPVIAIDEPMMQRAVETGGRVLVVATHGPTVESTRALLEETAARVGTEIAVCGATVEEAFELLGAGEIARHNEAIADAIRGACEREPVDVVVLAQLSMSVFKLSYPDCRAAFGVDVLTSGEEGFRRARAVLERV